MTTDIQRFTTTLAYIEEHLFENISLKQLAGQALLSEYTFHRFFTYLTGYSFSSYLRNRRLSESVELIRKGILTIDEISDLCGYANRPAFNRAFTRFHELTPSQAKETGASINFFPPIRLNIQIDGGRTLNYRVEQLPKFQVVGQVRHYPLDDQLFEHTGRQWEHFFMDTKLRSFAESDAIKKHFFGINRAPYFAIGNPSTPAQGHLSYFTGFVLNPGWNSEYETFTIPAQRYAVFTSEPYDYRITERVTNAYHRLQQEIFNSWLPQTEYIRVNGPELETYVSLGGNTCLEIWLPITSESHS